MARAALGLLAALVLLPGCVRSVPSLAVEGHGDAPGILPQPPAGGWPDLERPYPLLPGDQIEIRLLEPVEFAFTFTETLLPPDGEFELLRSGTEGAEGKARRSVKAKGKTVTELKDEMIKNLDDGIKKKDKDKQYEMIFEAIAFAVATAGLMWLPSQMVMNVLGKGPVPPFAPPYVPVGPCVAGAEASGAACIAAG